MDSEGHTETQAMQPVHSAASPLTIAIFSGSSAVAGGGMSVGLASSDRMSTGQFSAQSPHPSHVSTLMVTMYAINRLLRLHYSPRPARSRTMRNSTVQHRHYGSNWGHCSACKPASYIMSARASSVP